MSQTAESQTGTVPFVVNAKAALAQRALTSEELEILARKWTVLQFHVAWSLAQRSEHALCNGGCILGMSLCQFYASGWQDGKRMIHNSDIGRRVNKRGDSCARSVTPVRLAVDAC